MGVVYVLDIYYGNKKGNKTEFEDFCLAPQFLTVKLADGSVVKRGPYPLLTRKQEQKTVSLRLKDPELLPVYRRQIQTMREFETVVDQIVRVGEQLSDLAVAEVVQKKTPGGTGTNRRGASPGRGPGRQTDS